jgi:nicotinate-nucleotide adenylyltransferase
MINPDPPSIEPVALLGGTFDPVHYGHLRCAEEARLKLGLKTLFLLPAGIPPHRDKPRTTTRQRLDMLELAQREFPSLKIDERETRRSGPSYMVDTLRELREEFSQNPLLLLIGQDAANLLHTWSRWQQLFSLAHIVILTRPFARMEYRRQVADQIQRRLLADPQKLLSSKAGGVLQLEVASIDVSATQIKSAVRRGGALESFMPKTVIDYIHENRLYLSPGTGVENDT